MNPYVLDEPPVPGSPVHKITVRTAEGLDRVEIVVAFDRASDARKAFSLFLAASRALVQAMRDALKEAHRG